MYIRSGSVHRMRRYGVFLLRLFVLLNPFVLFQLFLSIKHLTEWNKSITRDEQKRRHKE